MTVVAYPLGRPRAAALRGGDCRARDLDQGRNIHGPHRFAATAHCQISNGLLRLTVGASDVAPKLTVEAWRGKVTIEDYLSDILSDTLEGTVSTPAWLAMGTVTIDSPSVSVDDFLSDILSDTLEGRNASPLTAVRIPTGGISPERVTLWLVAPSMGHAFVTLRRGERKFRIQHGSTRAPLVTDRRVRWTAAPSPSGVAYANRVQEDAPKVDGFWRVIGAAEPVAVDAGSFSLTTPFVRTARFFAGVATDAFLDRPHSLHAQLGDASRPQMVVS